MSGTSNIFSRPKPVAAGVAPAPPAPPAVFPGAVLRFVSGTTGFEVASVNRKAATLLHATADDLCGTGFVDRLFIDDARLLAEALADPDRERAPFVLRWGASAPVAFLGVDLQSDADGTVLAALHHTGDRYLPDAPAELALAELLPPGRLVTSGGRLTFHDGPARRMLGPSVEDPNRHRWVETLRAEHRTAVREALEAAASKGRCDRLTAAVDGPDGGTQWLRIETAPSSDEDGIRVGYAVTVLDITAERTAREESERTQEQFWRMANHDSLTGLPNRSHFTNRFDQAIARSRRDNRPAALLVCDLDHFHQFNDEYGRAAGDGLLIEVAHRLTAAVRESDTVCRLGGDEFVVLCEAVDDLASLDLLGRRLIEVVNGPVPIGDGATTVVGVCVGSASTTTSSTVDQVLAKADAAVYQAKRNGRNGYVTSGSRFALFGTNP
jgi:diguanylate cyclase (GGDEF)-like protein/PAS domain S-box-containing protein